MGNTQQSKVTKNWKWSEKINIDWRHTDRHCKNSWLLRVQCRQHKWVICNATDPEFQILNDDVIIQSIMNKSQKADKEDDASAELKTGLTVK